MAWAGEFARADQIPPTQFVEFAPHRHRAWVIAHDPFPEHSDDGSTVACARDFDRIGPLRRPANDYGAFGHLPRFPSLELVTLRHAGQTLMLMGR